MAWAHKFLAQIVGAISLALAGHREITKEQYAEWADMLDRISAWFRQQSE